MTQQTTPTAGPVQPVLAGDPISQSADIVASNLARIRDLFPDAVTESGVDLEVLQQLLGEAIDDSPEKFGLNWPGKKKARHAALTPSTGTLLPEKDKSVDWDTTQNIFIEGDNLEVLKLLQKSYAGKVKMIYIDPPYNTGNEFVYNDKFAESTKNYLEYQNQIAGATKLQANTDSTGRRHSNWLSMMYPRLRLGRNLLTDDGVIAASIDSNELANLIALLNECFGEENQIAIINVVSNPRGRQSDTHVATVCDYIVVYAKNAKNAVVNGMPLTDAQRAEFPLRDDSGRSYRLLGLRQRGSASLREDRPDMFFPIYVNPSTLEISLDPKDGFTESVLPKKSTGQDGRWMWGQEKCRRDADLLVARLIERRDEFDIFVRDYLERDGEERTRKFRNLWDDKSFNTQVGTQEVKALLQEDVASYPKPVSLIESIIQLGAGKDDMIVDFFAGSGTTGHAVMQMNAKDGGTRRFLLVQLDEPIDKDGFSTIADITRARLAKASGKSGQRDGFRSFRWATSNIAQWASSEETLETDLLQAVTNLDAARSEADILTEVALKLGLDLTTPIESIATEAGIVYSIGFGTIYVCLGQNLGLDEAEAIGRKIIERHQLPDSVEAKDVTILFRDSGFVDDVAKLNLAAMLDQADFPALRTI